MFQVIIYARFNIVFPLKSWIALWYIAGDLNDCTESQLDLISFIKYDQND